MDVAAIIDKIAIWIKLNSGEEALTNITVKVSVVADPNKSTSNG
jgi:hypothetical protein